MHLAARAPPRGGARGIAGKTRTQTKTAVRDVAVATAWVREGVAALPNLVVDAR